MNVKEFDFKFFNYIVYKEYLNDFPKNERVSISDLKILYINKKISFFGLFDENDNIYSYAVFINNDEYMLLWYFATIKKYRKKGYGTLFLKLLNSMLDNNNSYKGIIIEVENDEEEMLDNIEIKIREKRISFYNNIGFTYLGLVVILFGVEYKILVLSNKKINSSSIYETYKQIYYSIRNKDIIDKNLRLKG